MSTSNTSARDGILAQIRKGLGPVDDTKRRLTVVRRLAQAPRGIVPDRALRPHAELVTAFIDRMIAQRATVDRVPDFASVPVALTDYLRSQNLPAVVRIGADPVLNNLPWPEQALLRLETGRAIGSDTAGLSHALVGAAETGTVALVSGQDNPTTINFLPDTHIVLVEAHDIVGPFEEAWVRIRARYGAGQMPRTVNWVSGPSRTADIEQTMVQGAHGPRRFHVIVVG
jgi:L-lactate dehydrogenase complex protein LldG